MVEDMSSFWILPAVFFLMWVAALATGEIRAFRTSYVAKRNERPVEYWFWMLFLAAIIALAAYGASTMPRHS